MEPAKVQLTARYRASAGSPRRVSSSTVRTSSVTSTPAVRPTLSRFTARSPPLAGVQHHAEGQGDPAVDVALGIAAEIEHVAIEDRELAVELTEHRAVAAAVQV